MRKQVKPLKRVSRIIGTAGHIDHGKTSLIKALTGMETDRLIEEKKRGLSIDLGFAHIEIDGGIGSVMRAAIVDVPGHERFIKNMLAGATGMDLVLFTVAADDGVMPQTVEHLDIIKLLHIGKVIFVVTKCDLATVERILEVEEQVRGLVRGTRLEGSPFSRVSSHTGEGLTELKKLLCAEIKSIGDRGESDGFFRLPVDRSFTIKGFGTVVTGTVASGRVRRGDEVLAFPRATEVKVRGIETMHEEVESVSAGERGALNLAGTGYRDIKRGFILTSPELKLFLGARPIVDCFFEFSNVSGPQRKNPSTLKNNALIKVHHQTGEALARIKFCGGGPARPGAAVFGRLILRKPLLMLRGDRFILRDPSINLTVGGGRVFAAYPSVSLVPAFRKMKPPAGGEKIADAVRWLIPEGSPGIDKNPLSLILNIRDEVLEPLMKKEDFFKEGFSLMGDFIVDMDRAAVVKSNINKIIAGFHGDEPLEAGIKEEDLLARVLIGSGRKAGIASEWSAIHKKILDSMIEAGELRRDDSRVSLPSHMTVPRGFETEIEKGIEGIFSSKDGFVCKIEEIKKLPFKSEDILRVVDYLLRKGALVRIKPDTFASGAGVHEAKIKLEGYIKDKGSIRAAEFRDVLGCGRKLAIELLEYFDRVRVTLRKGDVRTLR